MIRNYITVEGEVKVYEYTPKPRNERKTKPQCPVCGERVRFLYKRKRNQKGFDPIGYICCDRIYLFDPYKVFKMTEDMRL